MTALCRTDSPSYHTPPESPEWVLNAAQEQLEERAENEMDSADLRFVEWLADYVDAKTMAAIIAAARKCRFQWDQEPAGNAASSLVDSLDRMLLDYKQFRTADSIELGEIEAEILAED